MNLLEVKAYKFHVSNDLIDPNEVVELFDSQLDQAWKRWKLDFDGKNPKKSMMPLKKFRLNGQQSYLEQKILC
jgi:hypothetical protein